jgi:Sec-independent protein translocase protein TatA
MMFGGELFFAAGLGFVILGPKRMQDLLGRIARVKTELQRARRDFTDALDVAGKDVDAEDAALESKTLVCSNLEKTIPPAA